MIELRGAGYVLRVASYALRAPGFGVRVACCEVRVAGMRGGLNPNVIPSQAGIQDAKTRVFPGVGTTV
jgi:hypothetical protein